MKGNFAYDKRFARFKKENKQLDAGVHRKYVYGGHVAAYMMTVIEDEPEKYQTHFSEYIKKGIEADGIEELYRKVNFEGFTLKCGYCFVHQMTYLIEKTSGEKKGQGVAIILGLSGLRYEIPTKLIVNILVYRVDTNEAYAKLGR
ncbi:hypothetical protein IFM89_008607 [Coptis chinensis]|uniref:60S ribosomal protein L5 n=1 Tax=Coptis chinensis TaxID=261450 RepID=A0A835HLA2_9MAGN|nr:hypothetical protein IFM89_008607 [Coptis chinensis]